MHVPVQMAAIILGGALTAQDPSPAFFIDSPAVAEDELFGSAVACAGDRVAVGAPGHQVDSLFEAGAVFVFSADGTYERTVTAPSPNSGARVGDRLAAIGDRFVIGDPFSDVAAVNDAGRIHIVDPATGVVTTILNPAPVALDNFGLSLGAFEDDILVRKAAFNATDSVYRLDGTTGGVVFEYFDPVDSTGSDDFGVFVGAFEGHVLVSDIQEDVAGQNRGAVYVLDSSNGNVLLTLEDPEPQLDQGWFGWAVAVLGTNLFVSAPIRDGDLGRVYAFDGRTGDYLFAIAPPESCCGFDRKFGEVLQPVGLELLVLSPGLVDEDKILGKSGAAYLFSKDGTLQRRLRATGTPHDGGMAVLGSSAFLGGPDFNISSTFDVGRVTAFDLDNRPPVAADTQVETTLNTPVEIVFSATDPDGDALTFQPAMPSQGYIYSEGGLTMYQPAEDFEGTVSIDFQVSDGQRESDAGVVSVLVSEGDTGGGGGGGGGCACNLHAATTSGPSPMTRLIGAMLLMAHRCVRRR